LNGSADGWGHVVAGAPAIRGMSSRLKKLNRNVGLFAF